MIPHRVERGFRCSIAAARLAATIGVLVGATGCGPDGPSQCVAGHRGCACTPLGGCDLELVCHSQQCVETHDTSIVIDATGARACEAVFQEQTATIADVTFPAGVRGTMARRGNRASIAFIRETDTNLTGSGIEIRWVGNRETPDFTVAESECFDRLGQSIVGAGVDLGR